MAKDTIYALSTVSGKSGVAVFRISGEEALKAIKYMSLIDIEKINSRHAYFSLIHDIKGETIDHGIIIYFKSPSSFTGEDIVEIHTHGSKAVISSVLENLSRIENFRLAEPGEFSKRAFYNGKMDLTEAEGLADLIDAQTSEQQKYALKQMDGGLKNLYESWREKLIDIMAYLEAYIDFPDEELPTDLIKKIENTVLNVRNEINQHLQQSRLGERLHEGFRVVIIGEPNAGKSSLFNALARKEAVIVSDIAGTTRDAIDIYMDINGYPIIFTDTAGLRDTEEEIEQKESKKDNLKPWDNYNTVISIEPIRDDYKIPEFSESPDYSPEPIYRTINENTNSVLEPLTTSERLYFDLLKRHAKHYNTITIYELQQSINNDYQ